MANFVDKLIPFNPYVEQQPVQQMVAVGMEKQQQYNTGVQKIQSSIDNMAGLDIMRPVDKNYLQSKLNNLGDNLKIVAAGDFSNYQLVNSVSGMVGSIGKDPNIQNAVSSTQIIRKGQKDLETAKQKGESSVQNEKNWNKQVNNYMNDKDLKTSFRGEYVPYTDLTEKYAEVAKDVEAIEYSYDQPYMTNADGSLKYFTTDKHGRAIETDGAHGQPRIDDAMKSISVKGKSAQTILNNFYDNTTENDKRQLAIDAEYHYENANADIFKNDIISTFALKKKQLAEYSTELTVALKSPKIPDKDKAAMQAKLNNINSMLSGGGIEKELASSLEELKNPGNLESFKTKLYIEKYLTNLAQDKSTESYKEELKANPYAQMNMENKKFQFDVQKENTRIQEFNTTHQWEMFKWQNEWSLKQQEAKAKSGGEPVPIPGGARTDVPPPTSFDLSNRINNNNEQLKRLDYEMLKTYTKAQLDAFADKYNMDPMGINLKDPDLRKYLDNRKALEHDNLRAGSLQRKLAQVTSPLDKQLDDMFKTMGGVADNTGREFYSAKELYNFWNDTKNFGSLTSSIYSPTVKFDAEGLLNKYKGTRYEPLAKATTKLWAHQELTPTERVLTDKAQSIYSQTDEVANKIVKDKLDAESNYLSTRSPEYMTWDGTLSKTNKIDMDMADQLISNSMNPPAGMLDSNRKSDWDSSVVTAWRKDEKTNKILDYRIKKNYDGSGTFIVQNGTTEQKIPLSATYFSSFFPKYAAINPITQMIDDVLSSPENTTNPVHKGNPTSASYTGYDLPNLRGTNFASRVRWDVEGDSHNTGDSKTDGYVIRVYVYDGKIWHDDWVTQRGYIRESQIQDAINMIGMDAIEKILKK